MISHLLISHLLIWSFFDILIFSYLLISICQIYVLGQAGHEGDSRSLWGRGGCERHRQESARAVPRTTHRGRDAEWHIHHCSFNTQVGAWLTIILSDWLTVSVCVSCGMSCYVYCLTDLLFHMPVLLSIFSFTISFLPPLFNSLPYTCTFMHTYLSQSLPFG